MGIVRICDVVPLGNAVKSMFNENAVAFKAFNRDLIDPYMTDTFDVEMSACDDLTGTRVLITLNKGKTVTRNGMMDLNHPLVKECIYKLKLCIRDESIDDSIGSFGGGPLLRTIDRHQIGEYHTNFNMFMARISISANRTALIGRGFTAVKMGLLQTNHDNAWEMSTEKIDLKENINSVSGSNKIVIDTFMGTIAVVVETMYNYYVSIGDKVNAARASVAAIMKGIRATPVKKMRNLFLGKTKSRVYQTNFVQKNTMQLLNGGKGTLFIVRSNYKTGPYTGGLALLPGILQNLKLKDIPGTGKYVVIYSLDTVNDGILGSKIIKG